MLKRTTELFTAFFDTLSAKLDESVKRLINLLLAVAECGVRISLFVIVYKMASLDIAGLLAGFTD